MNAVLVDQAGKIASAEIAPETQELYVGAETVTATPGAVDDEPPRRRFVRCGVLTVTQQIAIFHEQPASPKPRPALTLVQKGDTYEKDE